MEIIISTLLGITAMLLAVQEVISFRYKKSAFKNLNDEYFNPTKSWKNKYKKPFIKKGNKFLGSVYFFSFLTGFNELIKFITSSIIIILAILIINQKYILSIYENILLFLLLRGVWTYIYIKTTKNFK
jgi:hypothetical protein